MATVFQPTREFMDIFSRIALALEKLANQQSTTNVLLKEISTKQDYFSISLTNIDNTMRAMGAVFRSIQEQQQQTKQISQKTTIPMF